MHSVRRRWRGKPERFSRCEPNLPGGSLDERFPVKSADVSLLSWLVSSRLAFTGSMGSSQLPKRATYAGANAFINTFTQLLQSELEGTGVQVQALCPGIVQTEFHEQVGIDPGRYPAAIVMKPEDPVQASLAGLKLGEVVCVPTMEDPSLFKQIQDDEKRFFDLTRSGKVAERYRS